MKELNTAVLKLFREQHGVVYRAQLLRLGMTDRQFHYRLETGAWLQVYPGIYRSAARPVTFAQQLLAAHFAAGPQSVASHDSAAWLWGLLPHPPGRPTLTVPPRLHPQPSGVKIHRLDLDRTPVSYRRTIPCTNPLRTLVDLAATASHQTVVAAVDEALSTRLVSGQAIKAELERRTARGRRGVRPLREILTRTGGDRDATCQRVGKVHGAAPRPMGHSHRGSRGQDRPRRSLPPGFMLLHPVAMEVDGYTDHWSPEAAAHDHARRNELRLGGLFLLVYTWIDVRADQGRMYQEITTALARYAGYAGLPLSR
jgi:hypothetical protein